MGWSNSPWHGHGWTAVASGGGGGGGGGGGAATFVAAKDYQTNSTTGGTFVLPTGSASGDIITIGLYGGSAPIGSGAIVSPGNANAAYTALDLDYTGGTFLYFSLYTRTLNAADITNGNFGYTSAVGSSNGVWAAVYRGATTATFKSHDANTSTTTSALAGFAPAAGSKGVFIITAENMTTTPNTLSVSNGTWTNRLQNRVQFWAAYVFDQLTGYTNATSTISNYSAAGDAKVSWLVELT